MGKNKYNPTERIGVNKAEEIIVNKLGWIFREQPIVDMGIDAQIETVSNGVPSGKLIALQIKTGNSHFRIKDDGLIFYGSLSHLEYWLNHSLPVFLIAHLPTENETYWQYIVKDRIERTATRWKTKIPFEQVFDKTSKPFFESIVDLDTPELIRYKKLLVNIGFMKYLKSGESISVDIEEWFNKSYGRGNIKIILYDESRNEIIEKEWFAFYGVGIKADDVLADLFPWAEYDLDYEFYDDNLDKECVESYYGKLNYNDIYPYTVVAGEIAYYRFSLKLNKLGNGFLKVQDYILNDEIL